MNETLLGILLVALIADWYFGEPEVIWSRVPHPVVLFGKAVNQMDFYFNSNSDGDSAKYKKGAMAVAFLVLVSIVCGLLLDRLFVFLGFVGILLEGFIVFERT